MLTTSTLSSPSYCVRSGDADCARRRTRRPGGLEPQSQVHMSRIVDFIHDVNFYFSFVYSPQQRISNWEKSRSENDRSTPRPPTPRCLIRCIPPTHPRPIRRILHPNIRHPPPSRKIPAHKVRKSSILRLLTLVSFPKPLPRPPHPWHPNSSPGHVPSRLASTVPIPFFTFRPF